MPRWFVWFYEFFMAILAIVVLITLVQPDDPTAELINLAIWTVFFLDYGIRLLRAADKRAFLWAHIPELISIVPLDLVNDFDPGRLLRLFRLFRFVRLMRAGAVFYRIGKDAKAILGRGGAGYVLAFATGLVLLGGFAIWVIEPEVGSLGDGIWWSIVTVTTVGYGDFAPQSLWGRIVAVGLMVVGVTTLAALTGLVATHFIRQDRAQNPHIRNLWEYLVKWDDLPPAERKRVAALLTTLADQDDSPSLRGAEGDEAISD